MHSSEPNLIHDNINPREAWILLFTTSETIYRFILLNTKTTHLNRCGRFFVRPEIITYYRY